MSCRCLQGIFFKMYYLMNSDISATPEQTERQTEIILKPIETRKRISFHDH